MSSEYEKAKVFADSAEAVLSVVEAGVRTFTTLSTYTPIETDEISTAVVAKIREEIARYERDALDSLGNGLGIARKRSDNDPQSDRRADGEQQ